MNSETKLPYLDLTVVMNFVRRSKEIILCQCADAAILIDCRPDPAEVVGRISRAVIRLMLAKGWIAPENQVFAITAQGYAAATCHLSAFDFHSDLPEGATPPLHKTSRQDRSAQSKADAHRVPKRASTGKRRRSRPIQPNAVANSLPVQRPPASPTSSQGVDIRESYHLARTLNQMGQLYPNGIPYEIMSPEERELTQSHREYILQSLRENRNMSENDMECIADTFAYAAWHLRTQQPAAPATEGGEELWVVAFPKPE